MGKRLLVTGYGGFVAGSVVAQAGTEWDVIALSRSPVSDGCVRIVPFQLDLREQDRLSQVFDETQPTAVIHTAAIANIDYCETNQDVAEAVNVDVTQQLSELCQQHNARMVFCSTDTVFDGTRGMYVEEDTPHPLNYYGETKLRAEHIVQEQLDDAIVARLALVMGFPLIGAGNSFLARMIASFREGTPVSMPENEIRTPVDVVTLGRALLELAGSNHTGIIHLGGDTRLNRYEMGGQIAKHLGYPQDLVQPTNSNAMPGRAARPDDASLDNAKAMQVLKTPMLSLTKALDLILETAEQ
ncbi:MAG: NAD(P)-dependent oxidoreductase [Planctomycetaceae bacterium]|nr:NAD(P)-dependent oxidoreductase [Planctomycetaceae bacterium]